jgi:2-methylcitrate dehydratase PrpD
MASPGSVSNATISVCDFVSFRPRVTDNAGLTYRSKLYVLDAIAVMLAGMNTAAGNVMRRYVDRRRPAGECSAVGVSTYVDVELAAFANGVMGHALDFDDFTVDSLLGHASTVLVPATLSVAESIGASGGDLIDAYVIGCEVACKLGRCFNPSMFRAGWATTSVLGTLGAAMAAGRLMHLDRAELQHALAIACSQSSGIKANVGTMAKAYHAGHAAANGVRAAMLASLGMDAIPDVLERPDGFADVFGIPLDARWLETLGSPFEVEDPGFSLKQFPCCGAIQTAIEAVIELRDSIAHSEIGDLLSITSYVPPHAMNVLVYPRPETGLQGKFSMEYCIARAWLNGDVKLSDFTDERVWDERVRSLYRNIEVVVDPSLASDYLPSGGPVGATVVVTMADGRSWRCEKPRPAWDHGTLPALGDVRKKLTACAEGSLPSSAVGELTRAVESLDQLEDVRLIGRLLRDAEPPSET